MSGTIIKDGKVERIRITDYNSWWYQKFLHMLGEYMTENKETVSKDLLDYVDGDIMLASTEIRDIPSIIKEKYGPSRAVVGIQLLENYAVVYSPKKEYGFILGDTETE